MTRDKTQAGHPRQERRQWQAIGAVWVVVPAALVLVPAPLGFRVCFAILAVVSAHFAGRIVERNTRPPCEGCAGRDCIIIELTNDLDREQPCVVCDMRRDFE